MLSLGVVAGLGLGSLCARAQPGILRLANPAHDTGTFRFDVEAPAGVVWTIESASDADGPWLPVAGTGPGANPVQVPVTRPLEIFRARGANLESANLVGYALTTFKAGFNMMSNPFDDGRSNRVAHLLGDLPEGSAVYPFDANSQQWARVTQKLFGEWTDPAVALPPGTGFWLRLPLNADVPHVWAGFGVETAGARPQVGAGWNLLGVSVPTVALPVPQDGDGLVRYDPSTYRLWIYEFGEWSPASPDLVPGDGYWYHRGGTAPAVRPVLFLNNYDPAADVIVRLFDERQAPLRGGQWLAQLYAGIPLGDFGPIGTARPFLDGIGAGFIDSRGALAAYKPDRNGMIFVELRVWEAAYGSSYEESQGRGGRFAKSQIWEFGPAGVSYPPDLPGSLHGLTAWTTPANFSILELRPPVAEGPLRLLIAARRDAVCQVETSSDLRAWSPLATTAPLRETWTSLPLTEPPSDRAFFRVLTLDR